MEMFSIGFLAGAIVTIMGVLYGNYLDKGKRTRDSDISNSDHGDSRECGSMDVSASHRKRR